MLTITLRLLYLIFTAIQAWGFTDITLLPTHTYSSRDTGQRTLAGTRLLLAALPHCSSQALPSPSSGTDPNGGVWGISLDSQTPITVNHYAPMLKCDQFLFRKTGLENVPHTINVKIEGASPNPNSTLVVQYFKYRGVHLVPAPPTSAYPAPSGTSLCQCSDMHLPSKLPERVGPPAVAGIVIGSIAAGAAILLFLCFLHVVENGKPEDPSRDALKVACTKY